MKHSWGRHSKAQLGRAKARNAKRFTGKAICIACSLALALALVPALALALSSASADSQLQDEPATVDVTFDPNYEGAETTTKEQVVGDAYKFPETPTRENYDFVGWFTEKQGGTQITSETKVQTTTDHTLYAHWTVSSAYKDAAKTEIDS